MFDSFIHEAYYTTACVASAFARLIAGFVLSQWQNRTPQWSTSPFDSTRCIALYHAMPSCIQGEICRGEYDPHRPLASNNRAISNMPASRRCASTASSYKCRPASASTLCTRMPEICRDSSIDEHALVHSTVIITISWAFYCQRSALLVSFVVFFSTMICWPCNSHFWRCDVNRWIRPETSAKQGQLNRRLPTCNGVKWDLMQAYRLLTHYVSPAAALYCMPLFNNLLLLQCF